MATKRAAAREPRTLMEALLQHEEERHRRRMAELKAAESRLGQLDELVPALKAKGLQLYEDRVTFDAHAKVLFIACGWLDDSREWKLFDALVEAGFTEADKREHSSFISVTLQKGRHLKVRLHLPAKRPEQATGSAS